jgi:hypothetical protein
MARRVGYTISGRALYAPALYDTLTCVKCKRSFWRSIKRERPHIMDLFTRTGNQRPICRICRPVVADARETDPLFRDPPNWSPEDLLQHPELFLPATASPPPPAAPPADATNDLPFATFAGYRYQRANLPPGTATNLRPMSLDGGLPYCAAGEEGWFLAVAWANPDPAPVSWRLDYRTADIPASGGHYMIAGDLSFAAVPVRSSGGTVQICLTTADGDALGRRSEILSVTVPARALPEEDAGAPPEAADWRSLDHPAFGTVYAPGSPEAEADPRMFCLGCGRTFYEPDSGWCDYCGRMLVGPLTVYRQLEAGQIVPAPEEAHKDG